MAATTQDRIQVTKTPPLAHALDVARNRWPDEKHQSRLLERALVEWAESMERTELARRQALEEVAGKYPGVYPDGYLEDLREGWPE